MVIESLGLIDLSWELLSEKLTQDSAEKLDGDGLELATHVWISSMFLGPIVVTLWEALYGKMPDEENMSLAEELNFRSFYTVLTHPYYVLVILQAKYDAGPLIILEGIVYQIGYDAFFSGLTARWVGTLLFHFLTSAINLTTNLPKKYARTTREGWIMATRDIAVRSMISKLYKMSTRQITSISLTI